MSYRFARRPAWVVGHVLVLGLIVVMVNLGLWQLDRLDQRRAANARIAARGAAPVLSILSPEVDADRRVRVTGRWAWSEEVLVRNRSQGGQGGYWAVTPLVYAPGKAVLVARGFVSGAVGSARPVPAARPPRGTVTLVGLARVSQRRGSLGPRDPASGRLDEVARVDVARIQRQTDERLAPVWLQLLESSSAAGGGLPAIERPTLDDGPHLGYAVQWFVFSTVAVVGWPLILRRKAREG